MISREKSKHRRPYGRVSILILSVALLLAGCSRPAMNQAPKQELQEGLVKVQKVEKQSMGSPREQVAEVDPSVQLDIKAEASGEITQIVKHGGEKVQKGDVILYINSAAAKLSKESAEANLKSAEVALQKSSNDTASTRTQLVNSIKNTEDQLKELKRQPDENQTQYDSTARSLADLQAQLKTIDSSNMLASVEAQLAAAKASYQQASDTLENYSIKAPATGILSDISLSVGDSISPGTQVAVVQNSSQVKIVAQLTESLAALVHDKKEVVVYDSSNPSQTRKAAVTYLASVPDSGTRLYKLELSAPNADLFFKPGSRVQVQLTTQEEENVVAVPTISIERDGDDTYVFVLKGDKAERRVVKLGRLNGKYQEIVSGIELNESIIVSGLNALKDGDSVKVQ